MTEQPKKKDGRGGKRPGAGSQPQPYDEEKANVIRLLKMGGLSGDSIASYLKMGKDTLYKMYREEMEEGKTHCDAIALGALMKKILDGDTASILFYCKTRLGFRETKALEHTSPDGSMSPTTILITPLDESED